MPVLLLYRAKFKEVLLSSGSRQSAGPVAAQHLLRAMQVYSMSVSSGLSDLGGTSRTTDIGVISPRLPFLLAVFAQLLCFALLANVLQLVHCLFDYPYDIVCHQQFCTPLKGP